MAITVTNNMTSVDSMNTVTNSELFGNGASSLGADTDIFIQGGGANNAKINGGMANDDIGGILFNNWLSKDITNEVIVVWVNTTNNLFTKANGGVRIVVEDGTANQGWWYVGGSDTYTGGWQSFMVHGSTTFDGNNGTAPTLTDINKVGVAIRTSSEIMGGIKTMWVDQIWSYADTTHALEVTGTVTTTGALFEEIAAADLSNAYGIVQAKGGAFLVHGRLKLGDDGTASSTLTSEGEVIVFPDEPLDATQATPTNYLDIVGGTGTNVFRMGTEIGSGSTSDGLGGGIIKAISTTNSPFKIECTQSDVTAEFFGVTFDGMSEAEFSQANCTVTSCNISNSGTIFLNGAEMRKCFVSDSTAASGVGALEFLTGNPAVDDFRDNTFLNNTHALEWSINGANSLDLRNIQFVNNTADLRFNHTSGLLTVNISELGDTPSTSDGGGGGTIQVNNTVTVKVTVIDDETEAVIQNARVGVEESISKTEVINALSDASGIAQNASYNLPGDPTAVDIRVYDIDDAGQNKQTIRKGVNVTNNGLDITIRMPNNPQYTPT